MLTDREYQEILADAEALIRKVVGTGIHYGYWVSTLGKFVDEFKERKKTSNHWVVQPAQDADWDKAISATERLRDELTQLGVPPNACEYAVKAIVEDLQRRKAVIEKWGSCEAA